MPWLVIFSWTVLFYPLLDDLPLKTRVELRDDGENLHLLSRCFIFLLENRIKTARNISKRAHINNFHLLVHVCTSSRKSTRKRGHFWLTFSLNHVLNKTQDRSEAANRKFTIFSDRRRFTGAVANMFISRKRSIFVTAPVKRVCRSNLRETCE